jgi:hypothetical protein
VIAAIGQDDGVKASDRRPGTGAGPGVFARHADTRHIHYDIDPGLGVDAAFLNATPMCRPIAGSSSAWGSMLGTSSGTAVTSTEMGSTSLVDSKEFAADSPLEGKGFELSLPGWGNTPRKNVVAAGAGER